MEREVAVEVFTEVKELTLLQKIKGVLDEVHPNEWEVVKYKNLESLKDIEPYKRNITKSKNFNVLIHYPEVIITNSKGYTHKIKDLFVVLMFYAGRLEDIKGFRTTFSSKEFVSGYMHSHLPVGDIHRVNSFCKGSSEFNDIVIKFKNHEVTELTFKHLLFSINSFIKWESLEGGPYIKIVGILYQNVNEDEEDEEDEEDVYKFLTDELKQNIISNSDVFLYKTAYQSIFKVKIKRFKELLEALPNKFKIVIIDKVEYLKRKFPTHITMEKDFGIYTKNFNSNTRILSSDIDTIIEGIEFNEEIGQGFIEKLEEELTIKINELI